MNLKHANKLGPKKFSALMTVAETTKEMLDELAEGWDNLSMRYSNLHVDGEEFAVRVTVLARGEKPIGELIGFLGQPEVGITNHHSHSSAMKFDILVRPNGSTKGNQPKN